MRSATFMAVHVGQGVVGIEQQDQEAGAGHEGQHEEEFQHQEQR